MQIHVPLPFPFFVSLAANAPTVIMSLPPKQGSNFQPTPLEHARHHSSLSRAELIQTPAGGRRRTASAKTWLSFAGLDFLAEEDARRKPRVLREMQGPSLSPGIYCKAQTRVLKATWCTVPGLMQSGQGGPKSPRLTCMM